MSLFPTKRQLDEYRIACLRRRVTSGNYQVFVLASLLREASKYVESGIVLETMASDEPITERNSAAKVLLDKIIDALASSESEEFKYHPSQEEDEEKPARLFDEE